MYRVNSYASKVKKNEFCFKNIKKRRQVRQTMEKVSKLRKGGRFLGGQKQRQILNFKSPRGQL